MSNKVDKLFKDKLEGDSLQPSAHAWEKVEAHLGKKNKMVLWARVAAAVILLGLLTFAGINWIDEDAKKEIVVKKESGVRSQGPVAVEKPKAIKKKKTQPKVVTPVVREVEEPVEQIAIVPEPEQQPDLTPRTSQPAPQKGITLTYSLPAIKKQEAAPAEPLVAEQKKSGFERVMEIAKEVKNGDALGELRQAKDDIFALDFRKDKKNKQ